MIIIFMVIITMIIMIVIIIIVIIIIVIIIILSLDQNYELMPSCWLVLLFDCCCVKISSFFKR